MIDDEPGADSYAAPLIAAHPDLNIEQLNLREANEFVSHIKKAKPDGLHSYQRRGHVEVVNPPEGYSTAIRVFQRHCSAIGSRQ